LYSPVDDSIRVKVLIVNSTVLRTTLSTSLLYLTVNNNNNTCTDGRSTLLLLVLEHLFTVKNILRAMYFFFDIRDLDDTYIVSAVSSRLDYIIFINTTVKKNPATILRVEVVEREMSTTTTTTTTKGTLLIKPRHIFSSRELKKD